MTFCMVRMSRRQKSCAQLRTDVHHCMPAHEHLGSHAQICNRMQSVLTARLGKKSLTAGSLGTQVQEGEADLAAGASINAHFQVLRRGSWRGEAAPVWYPALRWGQPPVRSRVDWVGTGAGARPRHPGWQQSEA